MPNAQIAPTSHKGNITQPGIGSHAALLKTIEDLLGLPIMNRGQLPARDESAEHPRDVSSGLLAHFGGAQQTRDAEIDLTRHHTGQRRDLVGRSTQTLAQQARDLGLDAARARSPASAKRSPGRRRTCCRSSRR